jgi:hypothetical protein
MNRLLKNLTLSIAVPVVALIGLAAAPANAQDRNVLILNETQHTIVQFFAILGEDVLPVGQSVNINIDDGTEACLYDFKAVFDDGEELVRNRIDVCTIGTYRYTEG